MQAQGARESLAQNEAQQEDLLRKADEVDPAVDHRADDYSPTTPTGTTAAQAMPADQQAVPPTTRTGGAHAGTPVDESGLPGESQGGLHR